MKGTQRPRTKAPTTAPIIIGIIVVDELEELLDTREPPRATVVVVAVVVVVHTASAVAEQLVTMPEAHWLQELQNASCVTAQAMDM